MSNSKENDDLLIKYCNNNLNDPKCGCLLFKNNFNFLNKASFAPYVCWYSPCLNSNNYLTSLLISEKKSCNVSICEISLGDIVINNGELNITNDCISLISPLLFFKKTINQINNYEIPNMFTPIIIPIFIILFIFLF
jgi:hypothetical protein